MDVSFTSVAVVAAVAVAAPLATALGPLRLPAIVLAGASIAEVAPIVLLSLFFSGESGGVGARAVLLVGFAAFVVAVAVVVLRLERSMGLGSVLVALQDTTAEIRVRLAFLLLAVFAALAAKLGLEAILGAFLAGATLRLIDRDGGMTHPLFRRKLEAVGFGVFVPVFVVALLVVRGLPVLLYRPFAASSRELVAGGLLQATSLGILVVAGQIGVDLGLVRPTTYAALVAAGLVTVIAFPLIALGLLGPAPDPVAAPPRAALAARG